MASFSKKSNLLLIIILLLMNVTFAQEKKSGPIIENYGKVWAIENPDYKVNKDTTFKAVFDIMNSPEDSSQLNTSLETAARFLNMHAQSGVPLEQLKVALVVHNKASKDVITSKAYKAKYGVDNPNEDLLKALIEAGVQVMFCGQSSASRGYPKEDLLDGVQLSLSAMTALIQLQNDNYRLIKF
ncbi:DsrE family protein [Maribacter sp. MMG018]|uniref:DsrE family protein n=1 Tax=Maribacter sp. MMG018 TaxID=2822688 RepID=UPI001B38DB9B|nr:DsrE family protein [Maribacter sp. MMG018]MBQ4915379.1 DsrE family protein [Maribacter sp. MMG018]